VSAATTPWQRGRLDARRGRPKLLFGRMYEDASVETAVFPSSGRVFTIASAGCTSMILSARGLDVTAVDINPAQIEYVRERLAGAPYRNGTADLLFAFGRQALPLLGLRRSVVRTFLEMDDPAAQIQFWRSRLDTARWRAAVRLVINRRALRLVYSPTFVRILPDRFDRISRARVERCFARHPNRTNPYAWRFFLGIDPPGYPSVNARADRIELIQADAAEYLERCPPRSFIGFSLSNILDGTEPAYGERLMAAARRSAQAGAVMVLRSFLEPTPAESLEWAEKDRSMLWGVVRVETIS
jgi:S-adenosylmethionine:diacylglycerol 3-amino-3-carboxypropyl transferase